MDDKQIIESVPATLKRIKIDLIKENKTAIRKVVKEGKEGVGYQNLVKSVRIHGVEVPVHVREMKDATTGETYYALIDGLHRVTAAKECGWTEIDAKIVVASDYDVLIKQLILNAQRIETKPAEYSKQLRRILNQNPAMTKGELAEQIGMSEGFIEQRLDLTDLKDSIAVLVDEGKINLTNAYALAKLPIEEQENWKDRAITDDSKTFVPKCKARQTEIEKANRAGREPKPDIFVPVEILRKKGELIDEFHKPTYATKIIAAAQPKTMEEAFKLGVAFCINMDPLSIEAQKQKDEAQRKMAADAKDRAKAKKSVEKIEEAELLKV